MTTFPKGGLWYARRAIALALGICGVPCFFFFSDLIGRSINGLAKFSIEPSYVGGRVSASFTDPIGDDRGFGALSYPRHETFAPGSLDLVRYVVHEPVYWAKDTGAPEYWQIDFQFRGGNPEARAIRAYIDADSDGVGSASPRDDRAEGVAFDFAHPWDYLLAISGGKAEFVSADGTLRLPVALNYADGGKKVMARIPLRDARLRGLYTAEKTYHYVLVGAYSPLAPDGIAPVGERPSASSGGGSTSPMTPKVYDWLAPTGMSQETALAAWDEESFSPPTLKPVEVGMRAPGPGRGAAVDEKLVAELAALAETERGAAEAANADAWGRAKAAGEPAAGDARAMTAYGIAAFRAGASDDALVWLRKAIAVDAAQPSAHAYIGAIVARTAAGASPLAAMEIVSRAYESLDRAVSLASDPSDVLNARISRASVSRAVPEAVFGKSAQGSEDYLAAADAFRASGSLDDSLRAQIADMYLGAAICLENAGKADDASVWFSEVARMVSALPADAKVASTRLELARRGYLSR